jgi:hypothetical protein
MRDTFLRLLTPDERNHLYLRLDEDTEQNIEPRSSYSNPMDIQFLK